MDPYEFLNYLADVFNDKVPYVSKEVLQEDGTSFDPKKYRCEPVTVEPLVFNLQRTNTNPKDTKTGRCQQVSLVATTDLTKAVDVGEETVVYLSVGKIATSNANLRCSREILTAVVNICVPKPGKEKLLYTRYRELAAAFRKWNASGLPSRGRIKPPKNWTLGSTLLQSGQSEALPLNIGMGMMCYFDVQYTYPTIIN